MDATADNTGQGRNSTRAFQGARDMGAAGIMAALAWFFRPLIASRRPSTTPVPCVPHTDPVVIAAPFLLAAQPPAVAEPPALAANFDAVPAECPAPAVTVAPDQRRAPTALGTRILTVLDGQPAMRKCDVASLAGIGRGSANRIVDSLVFSGWLREEPKGLFRVA